MSNYIRIKFREYSSSCSSPDSFGRSEEDEKIGRLGVRDFLNENLLLHHLCQTGINLVYKYSAGVSQHPHTHISLPPPTFVPNLFTCLFLHLPCRKEKKAHAAFLQLSTQFVVPCFIVPFFSSLLFLNYRLQADTTLIWAWFTFGVGRLFSTRSVRKGGLRRVV